MLIPFDTCYQHAENRKTPITGILHVGAHELEELPAYKEKNIQDIIWIEAQEQIVRAQQLKHPDEHIVSLVVSENDYDVLDFHITNNGQSSSLLEFGTHATEHPEFVVINTVKVLTSRLDTWIRKNNINMEKYNFLNLDIQGVELLAIRGLGDYIKGFDYVYAEVNEKELYKECTRIHEIDEYLASHGLHRILTAMTSHGWGDALYSRIS